MSRNLEARLSKIEQASAARGLTHEDWLDRLSQEPMTEAESAALDARVEAEALAKHGSLQAAAVALRDKAARTRDPLDALLAADMEDRATMEANDALA